MDGRGSDKSERETSGKGRRVSTKQTERSYVSLMKLHFFDIMPKAFHCEWVIPNAAILDVSCCNVHLIETNEYF